MKHILATSALALILAGGAAYACPKGEGCHERHTAKMEEVLKNFPTDKAKLVRDMFAEMRSEYKGKRGMYKTHKTNMKELLTAKEFDKQAFIDNAKQVAEMHGKMKVQGAERLANVAAQLSQEERVKLAELLPKKGKKGGKGGKDGKGWKKKD